MEPNQVMARGENLKERLKKELIERRLINEEKFKQCLLESERNRKSLIGVLYQSSGVPDKELLIVLSQVLGYPSINISTFVIEPEVLKWVTKEAARKYQVLPVTVYEKTLTVAVVDPTDLSALDDIRARAGLRIKTALALPKQLEVAVNKYYGNGSPGAVASPTESFEEIMKEVRGQVGGGSKIRGSEEAANLLEEAQATPIIQLVNHLLIDAIRRRASDVFIEPWERTMRVRYRVDGVLEEILNIPRSFVGAVVSRIKVMSRLNIAEHRIPQDGRIKVRILGREVDLRVSILPTSYGEKACLRILDTAAQAQKLGQLGFEPGELELIRRNAQKPHGMMLITGPTGSGKTTTLYAILQHIHSPERNITTVEDPVEYQVQGINQVNVREQVGLSFPIALRSILRQDPDVILIGEIRDLTTMDIAVKAALTGHLVLTTLHTNDATSAVVRMINMGIEPFLIASSVVLISAQRLVRKLCSVCKSPYSPDRELCESLGLVRSEKLTFYRFKGCSQCRNTGFSGRTVITELFETKPQVMDLIMKGGSGEELRELVREMGMRTLREDGVKKVKEGITTVEEIMRVTSPEPSLQTERA